MELSDELAGEFGLGSVSHVEIIESDECESITYKSVLKRHILFGSKPIKNYHIDVQTKEAKFLFPFLNELLASVSINIIALVSKKIDIFLTEMIRLVRLNYWF